MRFRFYGIVLITLLVGEVVLLTGCKKDPVLPTITTEDATNITVNTATAGGNITSNGGAEVTSRGVCWGTVSQPLISGPHTSDSKGNGSFTSNINGLTQNTLYYVRAYAINSAGTAYGNEVTFTSATGVATITTTEVTTFTATTAVSGGTITGDGGAPITVRGVCWGTAPNPTTTPNKTTNGTGTGNFASDISQLQPGTQYHVRAYATNSTATTYGNDVNFTTLPVKPGVTTSPVSVYSYTTATVAGDVTSTGGAPIVERGICFGTAPNPTLPGNHVVAGSPGTGAFTCELTNLASGTQFYVKAYASNSAGITYGNEQSFTTRTVQAPTVTTTTTTGIGLTTAVSGGNITNDNGGTVTLRGVCWNTTGNPSISDPSTLNGQGSGPFPSNISGLTAGTVFYVRAYATNSVGTGYGSVLRFSTSISDTEGNVYRTVVLGTQLWMQSDLKTTTYSDNLPIPEVTNSGEWATLTSPAYCWYGNDPSYGSTYGILYNWHAVGTAKLCPAGWHIPLDTEFNTMEMFLGLPSGQTDVWGWRGSDQGTQLKDAVRWDGTNTSGFSALPGGYRYGADGSFSSIGIITYWWTSTLDGTNFAWYRRLDGNNSGIYRASTSLRGGKFIRCVKN